METYLAYLATVGVFFATPPGPSQLLMISNSLSYGFPSSTATLAGDLSANALQMTLAAFGLASLVAASPGMMATIKWLGVLYLIWIGFRTMRAPMPTGISDGSRKRQHLFRQGFVTSAVNPKAVFFFAALFPQFIDREANVWAQLAILGVTYLLIDGLMLCLWGGMADRAQDWFGRRGRVLGRVSGMLMIAAAFLLALKDVTASDHS